jgi:hypothetical protein
MINYRSWLFAAFSLCLPVTALAQTEPNLAYVYATYFECNPADEARADEIVARTYAPHYDAAVEAGAIRGWSWLTHFVGGKWRRVLVLNANDMDSLLDASGALGEIIEEATPEAGRAFSDACPVHEDYIWRAADGLSSTPGGNAAGDVRFSMYIRCDMSREDRADELVREQLAGIYNSHVKDGELTGWAMLRHEVGGQWRRLLTMAGHDHKTVMRIRTEIIEQMSTGRAERAIKQFNEICSVHEDYLWDVNHQNP